MNDQQIHEIKNAAILNARVACFNAEIAVMTAENAKWIAKGEPPTFDQADFIKVSENSECYWNDIVELMYR